MRAIDVTGPIETGMWTYGSPFPPVEVRQIASLQSDGFAAHRLNIHTLTGTYLETAEHLFADREKISDIQVERFISRVWIAQLTEKQALEPISAVELEAAVGSDFKAGDSLLVATGWDRNWNHANFINECPYFLPETMKWVVERGVSLLGLDIPSVQDPRTMESGDLSQLELFYKEDRLLLAPLINLRQAGKGTYTLIVLPLNIPGVCASPCRAILIDQVGREATLWV